MLSRAAAPVLFTQVEAVAGPQKETGGYRGHCPEQPEQEETGAVGADAADFIFDEDNTGIESGEKQYGSDTGCNE